MNPVLDASVYVSAISPSETLHVRARSLLLSHPPAEPYLVPALFRIEVLAALARRGEATPRIEAVDANIRGPRFVSCALDEALLARAALVVRTARLRAYDAVYVALALLRDAPLFTLDAEIAYRTGAAFPALKVVGGG